MCATFYLTYTSNLSARAFLNDFVLNMIIWCAPSFSPTLPVDYLAEQIAAITSDSGTDRQDLQEELQELEELINDINSKVRKSPLLYL